MPEIEWSAIQKRDLLRSSAGTVIFPNVRKDEKTGYVTYDKEHCAHCFMCVMACPYGVLKPDAIYHYEVMKCDMCVHRSEDGSANPMCVEKCPMHAITLVEVSK